jgi:hypothetical protein
VTTDERTALANLLWRSVRRLVPSSRLADLDQFQSALEATYNDHAEACVLAAYREAAQGTEEKLETIRREAFRSGMLAVQKRSDYRDLDDIQDPEELRSTH